MTLQSRSVRRSRIACSSALLLSSSLMVPLSQAQMLEEVIVTAQKREQNLQDVPIAVSAFTGEMLAQSGVKDMLDLASNTPSLIVGTNQTSTATTFGIRGVFTSSQNFGLESSVGLYVDGVYRARQGSMINNLVDVASVEVLRGPQGTLFGRNTPAGAVSINSVGADHEGTGYIQGTYGEFDLLDANGAKSFSLVDNVLAMRATGFITKRDGFADDIHLGDETLNDRDRWGVRLQGLYTPNDDVTVNVILDHSEVDEVCCAATTWKNNLVAQDLPPGSAVKTGTDLRIQQAGGTVRPAEDFYDYEASNSFLPTSSNEDRGVSVQVDWQAEHFLLTSITGYRDFESYDNLDIDFANIDGVLRTNWAEQSSISQELRISNEYESFNYVLGLFYFEQDLESITDTTVGDDAAFLVQDRGALLFPDALPGGTGSRNVADQEHTSYAIFGQFDYNLSENFLLTAGLRWTNEEKDLINTFTEDASACPALSTEPGCPPPFSPDPGWGFWAFEPLAPRSDADETIDDDRVTGTLKLSWFMNDLTMFYASYGTGYKSGGINVDRIAETTDMLFDAETSEAYEIGMKADFPDQALRVNLAVHRTDTEDLQTISFQGDGFVLNNAGVAETYGVELDVFWQATENLTLTGGYAYNHGEYADFEEGPCWTGETWHTGLPDPGDPTPGDDSDLCDRSGGDVSGNPENVVVLTANQDFRLGSDIVGFVYGEYIFTDRRMTDVNNDPEKYDGSYSLFNLRTGLYFEQWDAELTLWGRNILDTEYATTIADTVLQDGNYIAYPNEVTTWGITAKKNF